MWYAGTRVPPRSCFRDHRPWRYRRYRRHGVRSRREVAASPFAGSPRGSATLRSTVLFGAHGKGICCALPLFACSAIHAGMRAGRAILNADCRKVVSWRGTSCGTRRCPMFNMTQLALSGALVLGAASAVQAKDSDDSRGGYRISSGTALFRSQSGSSPLHGRLCLGSG